MDKDQLKVLLVQFRHDEMMKSHEKEHVARSGKINLSQITVLDALTEKLEDIFFEDADLVVLGGSGEYSIFADLPCIEDLKKWLRKALDENKPVLGSCLGAQFMAEFLGGKVVTEEARYEVGTFAVDLTVNAKKDPLFYDFPKSFRAQIGHHQTIIKVPEGAEILAQTAKAVHAFAWPGLSLYAMQFHPELTKETMLERVDRCREAYAGESGAYEAIIETVEESPYTDYMISQYIDRIVLPRYT